MGILSSLQASNLRLKRSVVNHTDAAKHAAYPLLYDPQTAGGLLAGVPAHVAHDVVQALVRAGYHDAAVVGEVTSIQPQSTVERITCLRS